MLNKLENRVFLAKQKSILLAEKSRLEKELEKVVKFPDYGSSEESNAQEVEQFTKYKGLEKKIRSLLFEIEKSLDKIKEKKYGLCGVCGEPIEQGRLKIIPYAPTCVRCSEKG